jgi:hypothetical protein
LADSKFCLRREAGSSAEWIVAAKKAAKTKSNAALQL